MSTPEAPWSFYQHIRFTQRLRERDAVGMRQNPARQAIAQPLAISVITVAARQFTIGASIICIRAAAVSVASGTIPLLNAPVQRIAFQAIPFIPTEWVAPPLLLLFRA